MLNVLFIENCAEIRGGSWISLETVLESLKEKPFKPYIVFTSPRFNTKSLSTVNYPYFIIKKPDLYFNSNIFNSGEKGKLYAVLCKAINVLALAVDFLFLVLPHSMRLAAIIKKYNVSIVHLNNNIYGQLSGIIAAKITKRKCVCHIRSSRLPILKIEKFFATFIDTIIVISDRGYTEYINAGISPAKITVIYDPIKLDYNLLESHERNAVRGEIGIGSSDFCIGVFSRIAKGKGHDVLIKSALEVFSRQPKGLKFIITGEATEYEKDYESTIIDMARKSPYADSFIFLGYRSDVSRLIQAMDVVVDPSILPEGLRRTVVESMLMERAVIATNVGADADYVINNVTGFLVEPGDHHELAEKILYLTANKEAVVRMGNKSRELLKEKYNIDRSVEAVVDLYGRLMSGVSIVYKTTVKPTVSVIIPTYNHSRYISGAIDSVMAQTYKDLDIIVIDDGSSDNTREIIDRYKEKIRYFYQDNKGPAVGRNLGIKNAAGEYVAFLDADDVWLPQKLEKQVIFLENQPDYGAVTCDAMRCRGDEIISPSMAKERRLNSGWVLKDLLKENFLNTDNMLIRKEVLNKVGGFNESIEFSEDYDLWVRIAENYKIGAIDEVLTVYRIHNKNRSETNKEKQYKSHLDIVFRAIERSKISALERGRIISHNYFKIGYNFFLDKNYKHAQHYLKLSLIYNPIKLRALCYLLSSILPSRLIEAIRAVKKYCVNIIPKEAI